MSTALIVNELKELNEDFEWYPTSQRMIEVIQKDLLNYFETSSYDHELEKSVSRQSAIKVLDCGAGDGRVAKILAGGGTSYAIEKSKTLIDLMPNDVFIIGTDFHESTLIDKQVDAIFCNPPYSQYSMWANKLIREANAYIVYMIIPSRWQGDKIIMEALSIRDAEFEILGSDDFLDAERSARARVDIVAIKFFKGKYPGQYRDKMSTDPFDIWFKENFEPSATKSYDSDYFKERVESETLKDKLDNQLTTGKGLVPALVELYNLEIEHLQGVFTSICKLDSDVLSELGVDTDKIRMSLKQRITGLKNKYWKELFDNYDKITKRLTHKNRKHLLMKLTEHTNIDFTETNIYAISVWVIKNANAYFDSQLIDLVDKMIGKANVFLYKSNKRLFTDQEWRSSYGYNRKPEDLQHFGLELRIVIEGSYAIGAGESNWQHHYEKNLYQDVHTFLDDITTVAANIGFPLPPWETSMQKGEWQSNKTQEFVMNAEKNEILMSVKAFKNGNVHIKFNKYFIRTLNIEFGRLKGWLTNHIKASEELNIPVKEAAKRFKSNYVMVPGNELKMIGFKE